MWVIFELGCGRVEIERRNEVWFWQSQCLWRRRGLRLGMVLGDRESYVVEKG
jgi:hypothetical protein